MTRIFSPCIRLCSLDPASGLCTGCGRTITEIAGWLTYTEAERRAIAAALPARLQEMRAKAPAS